MSYRVACNDLYCRYGPFPDEEEAYRYAGLLDIDPACNDTEHKVEWFMDLNKPLPLDELREAIRLRIVKEEYSE